jgi:hypothetical protein
MQPRRTENNFDAQFTELRNSRHRASAVAVRRDPRSGGCSRCLGQRWALSCLNATQRKIRVARLLAHYVRRYARGHRLRL